MRPANNAGMALINPWTSAALALLAAFIVAWQWNERRDPREPPYIRSNIPFVGHIIGMIRYGAKYFQLVNAKTKHPIFALPMLDRRNYIVADPTLAGYVQRDSKNLSFYLLIVEVTRRLIQFDRSATEVTFADIHGPDGPGGLMAKVHEMMNRHLAPGPGLDDLTRVQMEHTSNKLNDMPTVTKMGLYLWLRNIFSWSNLQALYGPKNIFVTNPKLEDSFWQFEDGMLGLVIDVLPNLTARKAYQARKRVLDGLAKFVKEQRYKRASPLIQERVVTNLEEGMSERMAGHSELVMMFAILGNAVPSLFWLIVLIFSRPDLLRQIRAEVQGAIDTSNECAIKVNRPRHVSISCKRIQKLCPLLYSSYRETLRYISLLTSPRLVTEDTMLGGKYLLRKGSVVQIAGGILHYDVKIYGADAASFNPYRFMSPGRDEHDVIAENGRLSGEWTGLPLPPGVPSSAYRAFGGGNVLCPGRHFAQAELMATAAVLALGFDVQAEGGGALQTPEKDDTRIPLSVMKPVHDPQVEIRRREGWEDVIWDITV